MRTMLALVAALGLALAAGSAGAKPCKDASGKFVKCSAATATASAPAATTTTTSSPAAGGYTLDAKGKCHDASGKMAKKAMCAGASTTSTTTAKAPASTGGAVATTTTTTAMSSSTKTAAASTSGAKGPPHCTKGKPCGNSCIAQKAVCHKQ